MVDTYDKQADPVLALANRFFQAVERGDIATVRDIYSDDAIVWHNYDPLERRFDTGGGKVAADNIKLLSVVPTLILGMKYEVWFQQRTDSGFVQQHLVTGKTPAGEPIRFPVCVVCRVQEQKITSLYEYLDVNHLPKSVLQYFAEHPPAA